MMIDMDDPDHLRRRKLVNKGFTPRRVRESEDRIRLVCDSILDAVCEQGSCDLVRDVAAPLPMIMIGDALGVAPEDRADLLRWSDDMVSGLSGVDLHRGGHDAGRQRLRRVRGLQRAGHRRAAGLSRAPTT